MHNHTREFMVIIKLSSKYLQITVKILKSQIIHELFQSTYIHTRIKTLKQPSLERHWPTTHWWFEPGHYQNFVTNHHSENFIWHINKLTMLRAHLLITPYTRLSSKTMHSMSMYQNRSNITSTHSIIMFRVK